MDPYVIGGILERMRVGAPVELAEVVLVVLDQIDRVSSIDRTYDGFAESVAEPDGKYVVRLRAVEDRLSDLSRAVHRSALSESARADDIADALDRVGKLEARTTSLEANVAGHEQQIGALESLGLDRLARSVPVPSPAVWAVVLEALVDAGRVLGDGPGGAVLHDIDYCRRKVRRALVSVETGAVLE